MSVRLRRSAACERLGTPDDHARRLAELSTLRLEDLLAHDDPGVALRAIAQVMSSSMQLSRVVELDERLGVLEQRLGGEGQ